MPQAYPEIKTFLGLHLQQNSLGVPDGALEVADNVVVSKDGVIGKRRGFYAYYTPGSGSIVGLAPYQNHLIVQFSDHFAYLTETGSSPNETATATSLTGATVSITNGRAPRNVESNKNLYTTTDTGVVKITSFQGTVANSGAPPGLDLAARFVPSSVSAGVFGSGMTWGYRAVFGYTDANDNLILSAPSDIRTVTNAATTGVAASASGTTITVTSPSHGLVSGMWLAFANAAGFTTSSNANGTYEITVVNANSFTYVVASAPSGGPGTVDYAYDGPVRLELSVPSEIGASDGYFYQIYRSSQVSTGIIFSDFKLIDEEQLTSAQISSRIVIFNDDIDDILLGAELYTNENSREGELQANARAPLALDVTLYKGHLIYANCQTRQLLEVDVVDATALANGDYVELKIDTTTRRYVARTGVGNTPALSQSISGSVTLTVTYASHGLLAGDTVYISSVTGGSYADQVVTISSAATNTFTFTATGSGSPTALDFQGITNGTYPIFTLSQSASASLRLRDTAQGLVKAINRDTSSLIYAQYSSGINDVPGQMRFSSKGFTSPIYMRASSTGAGTAFSPVLPSDFLSGTQVYSRNDSLPNTFFASKLYEPEAVPLVNFFNVGASNKAILRVAALRDSLIVVKEDGIFRVTGDNVENFVVTILDSTVICVAASSVVVLNNQAFLLSNQGACTVTESSVQIVSRIIEDVIQPILGQSSISSVTSAIAYESERLYLLTTSDPNSSSASHVYVYNVLTEQWTRWDTLFSYGTVGPGDRLYIVASGAVARERKVQTRLDYCGQNHAASISGLSSDSTSCTLTVSSSYTPSIGDIVVKNDVINRIINVTGISSTTYSVTFARGANLSDGDSTIAYEAYSSTITPVPFHGGLVGRNKQFSQIQVHFRDAASASRIEYYFQNEIYTGGDLATWTAVTENTAGWGFFPWGFAPWGESEGINLSIGTQAAPIFREYIPIYQQRGAWIQPVLTHREAAETFVMQAMTYVVRAYGERVSR